MTSASVLRTAGRGGMLVAAVAVAMYAAGPQGVTDQDLLARGGFPDAVAPCDATGTHDAFCQYGGMLPNSPCTSAKYTASYQTQNQSANLDKLADPGGGNISRCDTYTDCTPTRDDRLLDQTCTPKPVKAAVDDDSLPVAP